MDETGVDYAVESMAEMAMKNGRGVGFNDGGWGRWDQCYC